jgi:hypothetical protein
MMVDRPGTCCDQSGIHPLAAPCHLMVAIEVIGII